MKYTAKDFIEDRKDENSTKVVFGYPGESTFAELSIEEFIKSYGSRQVTLNGDFIDLYGRMTNAFIKCIR